MFLNSNLNNYSQFVTPLVYVLDESVYERIHRKTARTRQERWEFAAITSGRVAPNDVTRQANLHACARTMGGGGRGRPGLGVGCKNLHILLPLFSV